MLWADLVTIAPLVGAIVLAAAIILVDLVRPGRDRPAGGSRSRVEAPSVTRKAEV